MEPDSSSDQRPVIQASEILAKIERGEDVEYDGVIVLGELDINGLDLPTEHIERDKWSIKNVGLTEDVKLVDSPINITKSEIRGNVNFGNSVFQNQVNFKNTKLTGNSWVQGSIFNSDANFMESEFCTDVAFEFAKFGQRADFRFTKFGGKANFELAKFGRDADFWGAEFGGDANFWNSTFCWSAMPAMFRGTNFRGEAAFRQTKFVGGNANFEDANFDGNVDFSDAKFAGSGYWESERNLGANFYGTTFSGDANFRKVEFAGGYTEFRRTRFYRKADFQQAEFTGDYVDFRNASFKGDAIFWNVKFTDGYADFREDEFESDAYFVAEFCRDAYFEGAEFCGAAIFKFAMFYKDVTFRRTSFGRNADFSKAQFGRDADFKGASFRGDATLSEANFSNGYTSFFGVKFYKKVEFNNIKLNLFYITWESIRDNLAYDGPIYLALIKNFKVIERFNDADNCYYQYRKESQKRKKWYSEENRLIELLVRCHCRISTIIKRISEYFSWINNYPPFTWIHQFNWSKLLDWIGFLSCGYGVRIQPIILWVLGSVLGFAFLYKLLPQSYGGIAESGPSTVTMEAVNNSTLLFTFSSGDGAVSPSWGECLYFSFTALTGGTPDGLHPVGLCKYAVMMEGVLGYLFLALFVVVLARKIIR